MSKTKKIIIGIVAIIVCILLVILGGWIYWQKTAIEPEEPDEVETVSGNDMHDVVDGSGDSEYEDPYADQDRTPHFETHPDLAHRATVSVGERNEEGEFDAESAEAMETYEYIVDLLSYDNTYYNGNCEGSMGFVVSPSANLIPLESPFYSSSLIGVDMSEVNISEYNCDELDAAGVREEVLRSYAFSQFLDYQPIQFTANDVEWAVGEGIKDYEGLFTLMLPEGVNPTASAIFRIIADTTIDTEYGKGLFFIIHNVDDGTFTGHAAIDRGDGYCMYITCRSENIEYVEPYIQETCSSVITVIQ